MHKLLLLPIFVLTNCHRPSDNDEIVFLTKNPEKITELKQKEAQCLQDNYVSCTNIGIALVHGIDVKQNSIKGIAYLDKTCNSDYRQNTVACNFLAHTYRYGTWVKKTKARLPNIIGFTAKKLLKMVILKHIIENEKSVKNIILTNNE